MSLKHDIEQLVVDRSFPLTRADLLDAAETNGAPAEVVTALQAIDDDHFEDVDELRTRLDEALGMPDADTSRSALEFDTEA